MRNETPYAVVSGISGVVYEICWYLRGLERWFMDLLTEPEFCEALLDQTLKFWLDWFRVFLDEVGDLVDVIMIGDDLAGQTGPLFRPEIYRTLVKPRQKQLVQYIRSRTQAKIWYHTCGSCIRVHPRPARQRHRHPQPGAGQRQGHGPGDAEGRSSATSWCSGAARSTPSTSCPSASPETVREHVRRNLEPPGSPAAATSSTTSTTSRPASRRRTSSPCSTRPTSSGSIDLARALALITAFSHR